MEKSTLLLGTRKGLIVYKNGDGNWKFDSEHFVGIPVCYAMEDHRNGSWWVCLDHGHWGGKLHLSKDKGQNWEEVEVPKYPEGEEVKDGVEAKLNYLWVLAPGGTDQPDTIYIGTVPGGMFRSDDYGKSFELVRGLWDHPTRKEEWFGGGMDHAGVHSIIVDPKDSSHIFVGISCAGVFETTDGGGSWSPMNKGLKADFLPDPNSEIGQDPHLLVASPSNLNIMWQQNHCGIFKSSDGSQNWNDISESNGPANFGFAVEVDEQNEDIAWVVPAVSDENRVAIDGALCVCRTEDGGQSWQAFRSGLPQKNCYDIVFRHALNITGNTLAFGTTTGNAYLSEDRGENWVCLNNNLPLVYSVRFAG
ncbi:MAG: glycosyl hydrolase [Bacteroidia bacterium]|nr:glycosyl hydrolase [Bacteroidia bacterium]